MLCHSLFLLTGLTILHLCKALTIAYNRYILSGGITYKISFALGLPFLLHMLTTPYVYSS